MFKLIYRKYGQGIRWKDEVLAGATVTLAMIPEAVAFAFVAGVDPLLGLYASFFLGLITAIFGGRPGMISGAAGATAVATISVILLWGLEYLFAAVILAGVLQILVGLFKMGRFIRLLPHSVMLGFVNGLAIIIGWAQFNQFKTNERIVYDSEKGFMQIGDWMNLGSAEAITMAGVIIGTMLICHFLPKFTRAVPAPLVAIVLGTLAVAFVPGVKTKTVADVVETQRELQREKAVKIDQFETAKDSLLVSEVDAKGMEIAARPLSQEEMGEIRQGLKADLPTFHIPEIAWSNADGLSAIFFLALAIASIGLVESLMTLSLIDELTETRGSTNRECVALGGANVVTGLFGGIGGCAMIGQSMVNINSGGRGRLSGIAAAVILLCFILFAPGLIEMIPIGCLIGVMFMVVIATFAWSSLRMMGKVPATDLWVILAVSVITVISHNLALAVGIGIIVSALAYCWERSKELKLELFEEDENSRTYKVRGPIFFGSIQQFKDLFSPADDPENVYLNFRRSKVCDHSAIEAIHSMSEKYRALDKKLHLINLDAACSDILNKAGDLVEGEFYGKVSGGH
ncbi:SulP family inorganic anion transporter [Verrucomicrobiaceae bacterium 227]